MSKFFALYKSDVLQYADKAGSYSAAIRDHADAIGIENLTIEEFASNFWGLEITEDEFLSIEKLCDEVECYSDAIDMNRYYLADKLKDGCFERLTNYEAEVESVDDAA